MLRNVDQDEDRFLGSSRGISGSFDLGFKGGRSGGVSQWQQPQFGQTSREQQHDLPLNRQIQRGGQQQWRSNIMDEEAPIQQQWRQQGVQSSLGQQDDLALDRQFQRGGRSNIMDQDIPIQQQQRWGLQAQCSPRCDSYRGGPQWEGQEGPDQNWDQDILIRAQWQNQSGMSNWNNQDMPIQGGWQSQRVQNLDQQQQKDWGCQQGKQQLFGRGQQQGRLGLDVECNWKGQRGVNQDVRRCL